MNALDKFERALDKIERKGQKITAPDPAPGNYDSLKANILNMGNNRPYLYCGSVLFYLDKKPVAVELRYDIERNSFFPWTASYRVYEAEDGQKVRILERAFHARLEDKGVYLVNIDKTEIESKEQFKELPAEEPYRFGTFERRDYLSVIQYYMLECQHRIDPDKIVDNRTEGEGTVHFTPEQKTLIAEQVNKYLAGHRDAKGQPIEQSGGGAQENTEESGEKKFASDDNTY